MTITAKLLLDSLSPAGTRLSTFEIRYPRFIHSEFMTHRMLSRNAASSRAIPIDKMIQAVIDDPALPVYWGKNQKGMQAAEELSDDPNSEPRWFTSTGPCSPRQIVRDRWFNARDSAVAHVRKLQEVDLHKQIANRLLEPWMHITVITSGTCWANFFHLRTHKDAQPEFQALAKEMQKVYDASEPVRLSTWDWHMPLIHEEDWEIATNLADSMDREELQKEKTIEYPITSRDWAKHFLRKVSVGRCARVSYLTHEGKRDIIEDIKLHDRLLGGLVDGAPLHMSPFEHVARALPQPERHANFVGFEQYRSFFQGEAGPPDRFYADGSTHK